MTNYLQEFAANQVKRLKESSGFAMPDFKTGDTVNVKYKITEGATTRIQAFKGVVIARTKSPENYAATFTVRKISSGVGVEILKQGVVRRAKLYYLRSLTGKASRIKEKLDFFVQSGATEGSDA